MAAVAAPAVEMPLALSIGTQRAFERGYEYRYVWKEAVGGYVCDHQTTTSLPGEVMAILKQNGAGAGVPAWRCLHHGR